MNISKNTLLICVITLLMSNSHYVMASSADIDRIIAAHTNTLLVNLDQNKRDEIVTFENLERDYRVCSIYKHQKCKYDSLSDSCKQNLNNFLDAYFDYFNVIHTKSSESCTSCLKSWCKCTGKSLFKENTVLQSRLLEVVLTFANQPDPIDLLNNFEPVLHSGF